MIFAGVFVVAFTVVVMGVFRWLDDRLGTKVASSDDLQPSHVRLVWPKEES